MTVTTGARPAKRPPRRGSRRLTEIGVYVSAATLAAGAVVGIVLSQDLTGTVTGDDSLPWLADQSRGQAIQVNPSTGRRESSISVAEPGLPFALAQANGLLVVTTVDGHVSIIDIATHGTTGAYQGATGTVALFDDGNLYAADFAAGSITRLDPSDGGSLAVWTTDDALAHVALDQQGDPWVLHANGRLHHLRWNAGELTDAEPPITVGGAGPSARIVAHPSGGVTVLAPGLGPDAATGRATRLGTAADTTFAVPGLAGPIIAVDQSPIDFIAVSLPDRSTVLLITGEGTVAVETSPYGCDRPDKPVMHDDLAWIRCRGAGLVIGLDRQGRHTGADLQFAAGTTPEVTVHNGWLLAVGPDGIGTSVGPNGVRATISGEGGIAAPANPPSAGPPSTNPPGTNTPGTNPPGTNTPGAANPPPADGANPPPGGGADPQPGGGGTTSPAPPPPPMPAAGQDVGLVLTYTSENYVSSPECNNLGTNPPPPPEVVFGCVFTTIYTYTASLSPPAPWANFEANHGGTCVLRAYVGSTLVREVPHACNDTSVPMGTGSNSEWMLADYACLGGSCIPSKSITQYTMQSQSCTIAGCWPV